MTEKKRKLLVSDTYYSQGDKEKFDKEQIVVKEHLALGKSSLSPCLLHLLRY